VLDNEREGYVLIKARPDKLIAHLIDERDTSLDPHYDEDFLLMYRVFVESPMVVMDRLLKWFDEPSKRDKVCMVDTCSSGRCRASCCCG